MMKGRRVPDEEILSRSAGLNGGLQPGDYGRAKIDDVWEWFVNSPTGILGQLWTTHDDSKGDRHVVTEHEDGTITVDGSIKTPAAGGKDEYHGHLVRGEWVAC